MPYSVKLKRSAKGVLSRLDKPTQKRIAQAIDSLAQNPHPPDSEKLSGQGDLPADEVLYRIRVGQFRIIYTVREEILLVVVVRVGSRGDVYKHLP